MDPQDSPKTPSPSGKTPNATAGDGRREVCLATAGLLSLQPLSSSDAKGRGRRDEIRTSRILLDGLGPPSVITKHFLMILPFMMNERPCQRFKPSSCCPQRPLQGLLVDGAKEQVQKEASSMELGKEDHEGDRFETRMLDRALARFPTRFLQAPDRPKTKRSNHVRQQWEPLSSILKTVARQTATIFTFQGRTCNSF